MNKQTNTSLFRALALALPLALVGGCGALCGGRSAAIPAAPAAPAPPPLAEITWPQPALALAALQPLSDDEATSLGDLRLRWHDARRLPIEGRGWTNTETFYNRLPARAKDKVPPLVWSLNRNTAGLCVRFITNSTKLGARWDAGAGGMYQMYHMPAAGVCGLDLYARRAGLWEFTAIGRPTTTTTLRLITDKLSPEPTEYLLYLPLYSGVSDLRIGIEPGAWIAPAPARSAARARPIVFYGTSITQGGCASRPGMAYPAILGRWLDREVINLGFSGSGRMEPEMADFLGELDPALYVLDNLPNLTTKEAAERIEPFVERLRSHRPNTPILLVEDAHDPETNPDNLVLRAAFANLRARGARNLYLQPGAPLLAGLENSTVDGTHFTDLGYYRYCIAIYPEIRRILGQ